MLELLVWEWKWRCAIFMVCWNSHDRYYAESIIWLNYFKFNLFSYIYTQNQVMSKSLGGKKYCEGFIWEKPTTFLRRFLRLLFVRERDFDLTFKKLLVVYRLKRHLILYFVSISLSMLDINCILKWSKYWENKLSLKLFSLQDLKLLSLSCLYILKYWERDYYAQSLLKPVLKKNKTKKNFFSIYFTIHELVSYHFKSTFIFYSNNKINFF